MPTFPDGGTRIWISSKRRHPFKEYAEEVKDVEPNSGVLFQTRSVYIAAKNGGEFVVNYKYRGTESRHWCLEIQVDGRRVELWDMSGDKGRFEGWRTSATTISRFAFGDIDVSEDSIASSNPKKSKQLDDACIQVTFYAAVVTSITLATARQYKAPQIAEAVHPDSKLASLVGLAIKPGSVKVVKKKPERFGLHHNLRHKKGTPVYTANFLYRPARLLIAQELMPEPVSIPKIVVHSPTPEPVPQPRERYIEPRPPMEPKAPKRAGSPEASAKEDMASKRARVDSPLPAVEVAVGENSETIEQRKKRLEEQLSAIKQELDAVEELRKENVRGAPDVLAAMSGNIIEVKNEKESSSNANVAADKVKREKEIRKHGKVTVKTEAPCKRQRIFVDLSADFD